MSEHFKGKDPLNHVAEKQVQGIITSREVHGVELPGSTFSFIEGVRTTALVLTLLYVILMPFEWENDLWKLIALFGLGMIIWLSGRTAWLGWLRLERLHRILAQEKWEIENNRPQEREELRVLYAAKGFEGPLLEEVVDVLMADEGRLLKVMVQEEMGFTLENIEHPLRQGLFAALGSTLAVLIALIGLYLGEWGLPSLLLLTIALLSSYAAFKADNRPINAGVWGLGLALLSTGTLYFLTNYVFG